MSSSIPDPGTPAPAAADLALTRSAAVRGDTARTVFGQVLDIFNVFLFMLELFGGQRE